MLTKCLPMVPFLGLGTNKRIVLLYNPGWPLTHCVAQGQALSLWFYLACRVLTLEPHHHTNPNNEFLYTQSDISVLKEKKLFKIRLKSFFNFDKIKTVFSVLSLWFPLYITSERFSHTPPVHDTLVHTTVIGIARDPGGTVTLTTKSDIKTVELACCHDTCL